MSSPEDLPARLGARVVALVSAVLPTVAPLPAPLRKIAGFAPARRARLGGQAIRDALADEEFRQHAAVQVAALPVDDGDRLDLAARAWLVREEGWETVVEEVAHELRQAEPSGGPSEESAQTEVDRLGAQVGALRAELVALRAAHRAEIEEAQAGHKVLRQRLGQARASVREAEAERDGALARSEAAQAAAASATAGAEADVRRLRTQLEEVERALAASRREDRSSRDRTTVRARYLLETIVEAATGLRRELGLPAGEGAPGDAVEAGLLGSESAPASRAPASPALLEQNLGLPRARLLVDGYNVTKQTWATASLEAQRSRLVTALGPLVARTGAETTVVFDAAASSSRTVMPAPRGVKVVFSPQDVIADDVIRQLVAAEPRGRVVVVVTSDQALAADVAREGARVVPASALIGLLT